MVKRKCTDENVTTLSGVNNNNNNIHEIDDTTTSTSSTKENTGSNNNSTPTTTTSTTVPQEVKDVAAAVVVVVVPPSNKRQSTALNVSVAPTTLSLSSSSSSSSSSQNVTIIPVATTINTPSESIPVSLLIWEDTYNILPHIVSYLGPHQYRFVASVNRSFQTAYSLAFPTGQDTYPNASTLEHATMCFTEMEPHMIDAQINLTVSAVKHNCLPALEYLKSVKCRFDSQRCTYLAAQSGQLSLLQWLQNEAGCSFHTRTCAEAADHGHLHVLHWLRERKCPWDEWTCAGAAHNGHLEMLQWARSKRCRWDEHTCAYAAGQGHLALLQWARSKKMPLE